MRGIPWSCATCHTVSWRRWQVSGGSAHLGQGGYVSDYVIWVADGLAVDGLCLVVDSSDEVFRVFALHKLDANIVLLQEDWYPSVR